MTGSCPKHMVMGPCGGVRADGRCEVVPEPCVFPAPAQWAEPVPAVPLRAVPLILTDFSSEPYSVRMLTTVARTLAPSCDAVLVGEHQDRPDFPPTLLASMLQDAGVRPWMTLACRDRNRIVLEEELSGLRHLEVDAVLCVTGDARAYDVRPDVTQVFDLDGPRLAALAASIGISAAAENIRSGERMLVGRRKHLVVEIMQQSDSGAQAPGPPPSGTQTTTLPAQAPPQGSAPLRVMVGKSLLINTTERLRRISITDPAIAWAQVITPTQILVHGRSPGEISLLIWDESERSRSFDLRVDVDVSACAEEEHRVFPDEQITVTPSRAAVVLSGHVSTEDVAKRAGELASAYSPKVVNVLTFGPVGAQEVLLQVKFAEVDRTALAQMGGELRA